MNGLRSDSIAAATGSSPENVLELITMVAAGMREVRLAALLVLALVASTLVAAISIHALATRRQVVIYEPVGGPKSSQPAESEIP
jgi:hypothetical protein